MTIKSQDDLNKPEAHSTEVLLSTIEKCERTKKQLEIAVEALKVYEETFMGNGTNRVTLENGNILEYNPEIAKKALEQIKELEK